MEPLEVKLRYRRAINGLKHCQQLKEEVVKEAESMRKQELCAQAEEIIQTVITDYQFLLEKDNKNAKFKGDSIEAEQLRKRLQELSEESKLKAEEEQKQEKLKTKEEEK